MNNVNDQIEAENVKLVDNNGNMLGETSVKEAIERAKSHGLDLIQLSNEDVPVCRIANYGKFAYDKNKRAKNVQKDVTKEVKFRPNIEEHDLQTKINSIKKFLEKKNRVKITVQFKGREISHSEIGARLMERIVSESAPHTIQSGPTFENNAITLVLAS